MLLFKKTLRRNSRCCCNKTPLTAGRNWDYFYLHLIQEISKVVFQESSVMQYTPSKLDAIQFAQYRLALLLKMHTFHKPYACYKCVHFWQKTNLLISHSKGKKYQDFIQLMAAFPYSNLLQCHNGLLRSKSIQPLSQFWKSTTEGVWVFKCTCLLCHFRLGLYHKRSKHLV